MSNHSPLPNESIGPSGPESDRRSGTSRLVRSLKGPAQFLSFWVAIALPFVHLPLLAQGLGDIGVTTAFFALLAINVLALYVGHGYNQE
ncbi:hypothetical protein [Natrarchaeobius chitinivorans]|uniref:Uncharacterized protein n=1 Tax=Natrarchaeobius chitinivorans TaxID=1679083 RepID=A0A3N6PDM3_NATCH|nr:hypothetical protein [Natrarchaeobius chitinivorans]RQG95145.1 hypothetical protein EA473_09350 [Natrarchaeobius chitinivorans]